MENKAKKKSITVIIKPSNACNIRCRYCYNSGDNYCSDKMTEDQVRFILEKISDEYNQIRIIWHGGEPLLMGIEFYERALHLQRDIEEKKRVSFLNSVQTNATLINDEWGSFFEKNSIKVGVSFDGPPFGASGRPSWNEALSGISVLEHHNIKFGIIAVINGGNIAYLNEIYDYFVQSKHNVNLNCAFTTGQLVDPVNQQFVVNHDDYVSNMIILFDRWLTDTSCKSIINPFYDISRTIIDRPHSCEHTSCLYKFISIDHNGNVFPCGRFDGENMLMGNIYKTNSIHELFEGDNYKELVRGAICRRNKCINNCPIYKYCAGGCNFNAILSGNLSENGFADCTAYKKMISHVNSRIAQISQDETINLNRTVARLLEEKNKPTALDVMHKLE